MSTTEHPPSASSHSGGDSVAADTASGLSAHVARLRAMIAEALRAARRVMDTPVTGPRGQQLSLTEAQQHAHVLQNKIAMDEARGSLRHRTVSRAAKVLTLLFVGVIDFPIMLWLASSVFNVDWDNPIGLPLTISIVISLLGTAGSAWVLYHLGHNRRENKNDHRQLAWPELSFGAKLSLIGVGLLIALISVVMFVRVYTEGVLSGLDWLSLLLAVLIAFIMLLSAALVFSTAFRGGSPEQDDLAHYSAQVQDGLQRKRALEDRADQLRGELDMLLGRIASDPSGITKTDPTEPGKPIGAHEHSANEAATNGVANITSIETLEGTSPTDASITRRSVG